MNKAAFIATVIGGLVISTDVHPLVGDSAVPKVVVVKGEKSGWCYKTVREVRPFERLYKSRSLYQYHFIDTESCQASTLPPERIPGAKWTILKVRNSCYEVLRVPLITTIGIYSPDHTDWEHTWGVQITCP